MSALSLLDPPPVRDWWADGDAGPLAGSRPAGGERTLDDVVTSAWEELAGRAPPPCPVCAGTLVPRYGAGAAPVGGRCGDCGSELT